MTIEEKLKEIEDRSKNGQFIWQDDCYWMMRKLQEAIKVIQFYGNEKGDHWAACRDEDTAETCCHMIAEISGGEKARAFLTQNDKE